MRGFMLSQTMSFWIDGQIANRRLSSWDWCLEKKGQPVKRVKLTGISKPKEGYLDPMDRGEE